MLEYQKHALLFPLVGACKRIEFYMIKKLITIAEILDTETFFHFMLGLWDAVGDRRRD